MPIRVEAAILGQVVVDLHCHILPRVDDGARDVDDSIAMARQAAEDGIGVVCATPHIRHDHDVVIGELRERAAALNAELAALGIPVLIEPGGEVAETMIGDLTSDELRAVSLGGTGRWVLLEPAPGPLTDSLSAAVDALEGLGARAVIAHPERHWTEDTSERLAALVDRGALIQVTAAAVEEPGSGPMLVDLAQSGLVHLVASDCHSSRGGRPLEISRALRALARAPALRTRLDWVAGEAPEAILRGEDLEPPFRPT